MFFYYNLKCRVEWYDSVGAPGKSGPQNIETGKMHTLLVCWTPLWSGVDDPNPFDDTLCKSHSVRMPDACLQCCGCELWLAAVLGETFWRQEEILSLTGDRLNPGIERKT